LRSQEDAKVTNPEYALARIKKLRAEKSPNFLSLAKGLLASVSCDFDNEPPDPPTVNQVLTYCPGVAKSFVWKNGIVVSPSDAFKWVIGLDGAPAVKDDTFRQWFRKEGRFNTTFGKEAYRIRDGKRIFVTYAQCVHLCGYEKDILADFASRVTNEFKL